MLTQDQLSKFSLAARGGEGGTVVTLTTGEQVTTEETPGGILARLEQEEQRIIAKEKSFSPDLNN